MDAISRDPKIDDERDAELHPSGDTFAMLLRMRPTRLRLVQVGSRSAVGIGPYSAIWLPRKSSASAADVRQTAQLATLIRGLVGLASDRKIRGRVA